MSHYEPEDFLISGKDVICAWVVAVAVVSAVFFLLPL